MGEIKEAMETAGALIILFGILYFIIHIALCVKCGNIAEEKGYSGEGGKYCAICFFFGIIGFCLVAALPDKGLYEEITRLKKMLSTNNANSAGGASPVATNQYCPHCGTLNDAKSSICKKCGQYMNG